MKNNISRFGLIIAAVACCWACKKDLSEVHRNTDLNQKLESIKNEGSQRVAYNAMIPEEKLTIWQNHLQWAKDNINLTPEQRIKVDEIEAILDEKLFTTTSGSDDFEVWKATVAEVFNPRQMYLLFNQPFSFKTDLFINTEPLQNNSAPITKAATTNSNAPEPCNCRYNNFHANFPFDGWGKYEEWYMFGVDHCTVKSGGAGISILRCKAEGDCVNLNLQTTQGCGLFFLYPCDGVCRTFIPFI